MHIDVKTTTTTDGAIRQQVMTLIDGVVVASSSRVINTQDAQIQNSLATLGWASPEVVRQIRQRLAVLDTAAAFLTDSWLTPVVRKLVEDLLGRLPEPVRPICDPAKKS